MAFRGRENKNEFSLEAVAAELGMARLEFKELNDTTKNMLNLASQPRPDDLAKFMQGRLPHFSDHGFDFEIFKKLIPYAVVANLKENNGNPIEHAYKLAVAFGDKAKAISYIKQFANQNKQTRHPFHDACNFLNIPAEKNWNLDIWRDLIKKHALNGKFQIALDNAVRIEEFIRKQKEELDRLVKTALEEEKGIENLQQQALSAEKSGSGQRQLLEDALLIATNQKIIKDKQAEYALIKSKLDLLSKDDTQVNQLKEDKKSIDKKIKDARDKIRKTIEKNYQLSSTMTLDQLFAISSQLRYKNASKNPEAAALFTSYQVAERQFNKYIKLKEKKADFIPNVIVNGEKYGGPRIYLKKLNPNNPRAAILGKITACCQSLGNAGSDCVVHGITSPYGGFYVVCKGDANKPNENDEIISQCWVWRSQKGNLVFDSIETQPVSRNDPKSMAVINRLFAETACQLVESKQCEIVAVGAGGGTSSQLGLADSVLEEVPIVSEEKIYEGYRDSARQRLVADKNQPIISYISLHDIAGLTQYLQQHPDKATENHAILSLAIASNNLAIVKMIMSEIEKIPNKEHQFAIMQNALNHLMKSTSIGNLEIFKYVLDKVPIHDKKDKLKDTLLIAAVKMGDFELIKFLVAEKANVTSTDIFSKANDSADKGALLLNSAIAKNDFNIVKILVAHGADFTRRNLDGQSPLDNAKVSKDKTIFEYLINVQSQKLIPSTGLFKPSATANKPDELPKPEPGNR